MMLERRDFLMGLTDDFLHTILDPSYRHCVDVVTALNTTVSGIYAHLFATKGGETLKIPAIGWCFGKQERKT